MRKVLLLALGCLGLGALAATSLHNSAALGVNLHDPSTPPLTFGLVVLVGAVLLPAFLGWLTHRVLRRRQPGFVAPGWAVVAGACVASWLGPQLRLSGSGPAMLLTGLVWPVLGGALAYHWLHKPVG